MKNIALIVVMVFGISCNSIKQDDSTPIIQLTKKRCLGKCPVYDVFLYEGGLVRYNGIDNVQKQGRHQFKIPEGRLLELQQLFVKAKFEELKDPQKKGRDLPITLVSYRSKTITFQGQNMPESMKGIVKKIEEMVGI